MESNSGCACAPSPDRHERDQEHLGEREEPMQDVVSREPVGVHGRREPDPSHGDECPTEPERLADLVRM